LQVKDKEFKAYAGYFHRCKAPRNEVVLS
jgi:hypothetical protein